MHRLLIPTVTVLAGLALGWLAAPGERKAAAGEASPPPLASTAPAASQSRNRQVAVAASPAGQDFASYVARIARPAGQIEAEEAATRMSGGELRELLRAAPEWSILTRTPEDYLKQVTLDAAAAELLRREGKDAIAWSEKNGSKATRAILLTAFLAADPREAKESLQTFYSDYGSDLDYVFVKAAFNAAAMRGADALRETQEVLQSRTSFEFAGFAKDFDFAGYFTDPATNPYEVPPQLIATWFARDPGGAAGALAKAMADKPLMGYTFRAALEARSTIEGEAEAVHSLLPLIATAPEPARLQAFTSLLPLDDARRETLLANLPANDQSRSDLATAAVLGDLGQVFGNFEAMSAQWKPPLKSRSLGKALPDEGQQIQALKNAIDLKGKERMIMGSPADKAAMLKLIMADWQMSAAAQEEVLASLPAH